MEKYSEINFQYNLLEKNLSLDIFGFENATIFINLMTIENIIKSIIEQLKPE